MKRPLALKNGCFIGVAACHRVLGRDRGEIVLWANAAMEVLTPWLIIATAAVAAAANEVAAGSKAGRIDNKAAHGVSPNQEASLGRRPKFSCSWSGTTGSPG